MLREVTENRDTLRDQFAAAALTGMTSNIPEGGIYHVDVLAEQSYELADAMLRERDSHSQDAEKTDEAEAKTEFRPSKKACMDAAKFASAVMTWISEATGAIDNCDRVTTADKEHVNSAREEVAKRYSQLMYGGPPDHDAAPAAKEADAQPSSAKRADGFTGESQRPFAWYGRASRTDGGIVETIRWTQDEALHEVFACETCGPREVVPLYRHPKFTDAQRQALKDAIAAVDWLQARCGGLKAGEPLPSKTLRDMLHGKECP